MSSREKRKIHEHNIKFRTSVDSRHQNHNPGFNIAYSVNPKYLVMVVDRTKVRGKSKKGTNWTVATSIGPYNYDEDDTAHFVILNVCKRIPEEELIDRELIEEDLEDTDGDTGSDRD